ncbi:antibiotic biosynthesis monooxygenase [Streptomyces sp. NPDC001966]
MAYLEITLQVAPDDRAATAGVYEKYNQPFLDTVPGAASKELLARDEDVRVLHSFRNAADAEAYLESDLFTRDVVGELSPLLEANPEVRLYDTV